MCGVGKQPAEIGIVSSFGYLVIVFHLFSETSYYRRTGAQSHILRDIENDLAKKVFENVLHRQKRMNII